MKSFIVFALFVAVTVAVPVDPKDALVESYQNDPNIGDGQYGYGFKTSDGKSASENGQLADIGTELEGIAVRGSFSYVGPDGITYLVEYTADKNGFQPFGSHIPKA